MFRTALVTSSMILITLAIACGPGVQDNPGGGKDAGTTPDSGAAQQSDPGLPCSSAKACPSGQFCWNGVCVIGCNTNGECAKDQYCDTDRKQCANKTVPSCPSTPCAETQECLRGFCSAKEVPATQCQVTYDSSDGCSAEAFCIDGEQANQQKCHTFPPCPEDLNCPVGLYGATCNDKLISGKAKVCLPGVCKSVANCPAQWKCIKPNAANVLGSCSNGSPGMPCSVAGDCVSGNCLSPGPGFPGVCN